MRNNTELKRWFVSKTHYIRKKIVFILSHLSFWGKFALFSLILLGCSFFLPWFYISQDDFPLAVNGFSAHIWYPAYFMFPLIIFNIFQLVSISQKKKFQYRSGLRFIPSKSILSSALIFLVFELHIYFLILSMRIFSSSIMHQKWIILAFTSTIMLFVAYMFLKKDDEENISWSFFHNQWASSQQSGQERTEENMKLPI